MTRKQQMFCEEYLSNGYNALQAYYKAFGKSPGTYKPSYPYALLKNPEIKAYIQQRRDERFESLNIDAQRVMTELADIAFAEKGDEIYTTQYKLKGLEQLAKIMGLQITKIETTDVIDVQLVDKETDKDV